MNAGERVYRALLRLYPVEFRKLFGEMMVDFYHDRISRDARGSIGALGLLIHLRLYADVVIHAVVERLAPLRRRVTPRRPSSSDNGERQMISSLRQDLTYALRNLRRAPAFTATVLSTLAIGIGANVAIFTVVNAVLLRPLPFAEPDRLIQLSNIDAPSTVSEPEVADLERDARSFSRIGAYSYADGNVTGGEEPERVRIARVNAGFFLALRPTPLLGRIFTTADDERGAPDVVVITHGLWQRRFGSDSSVIGRQIILNDGPRTVVGVMPPHFDYPTSAVSVWVPLRWNRDSLSTRKLHYLRVVARLAPGATIAGADAEVRALRDRWMRDYAEAYSKSDPLRVDVRPIHDRIVGAAEPYLVSLLGAVGLVLLIACVNVANLLLGRGEVRRKEIMIRSALGATRSRIAQQLALETALLTIGGGLLGVAAAWPTLRLIVAAAPGSIPRVGEIRLDVGALTFAAVVCVLTGILVGLAPIVRATASGVFPLLNSGSRNASQSGGRASRSTRAALVVTEVALAVMALAGASLFVRTLINLQQTNLGFATNGILTARVALPRPAYDAKKAIVRTTELTERARVLPGVISAAAMAWTPIVDGGGNWPIIPEGASSAPSGELATAQPQQVTPGLFATLTIPIRRGRDFTGADRAGGDPVVIINETLARRLWQTTDVLGRRLRVSFKDSPFMTVVGVVGDTRVEGLTEAAPPVVYFPHLQANETSYFASASMTLVMRTSGPTEALVPALKRVMRELDANVPLSEIRTLGDVVGSTIARHRFTTLLLAGLAVFAIALAAIGIYGVIAFNVAQRRYEFGVRMALGAAHGNVLALVLKEGFAVTGIGLLVGIAGVLGLGRMLESMLVGVAAIDPATLIGVSAIVMTVALLALAIPARRAMSVDPTEALRAG